MDNTISTNKILDNVYFFRELNEDGSPLVDCYLAIGRDRAFVIDTLQFETHLYTEVRRLTSLPVDVLLTHGHPDHVGASTNDFLLNGGKVYLSKKDFEIAQSYDIDTSKFTDLHEGMIFDGGGYELEVLYGAGHTPGSLFFLERSKQHLYTGDGVGGGVFWMQLPYCLPLHEFKKNLDTLYQTVKNMQGLMLLVGHRHQAPKHDLEFLEDTVYLTERIINGDIKGKQMFMKLRGDEINYNSAAYKTIRDYCYRADNI